MLQIYLLVFIQFNMCFIVFSRTVFKEPILPTTDELSYMRKFGYLETPPSDDIGFVYTPHSISEAVSTLQTFAGIPITGELDNATKQIFKSVKEVTHLGPSSAATGLPPVLFKMDNWQKNNTVFLATRKLFVSRRCGNKDIGENSSRLRRYVIERGWNKKTITYRVKNGARTLDKERVENLIHKGLSMWAVHGGLTFVKKDHSPVDIAISFLSGDHGDGFSFDGLGRVVAHAFPPPLGDMHFDDDELWGENIEETYPDNPDMTDFLAVAVHEIGHALGLSHSPVKSSVMYPYYQPQPVDELGLDDIKGMRELYLKGESSTESSAQSKSTQVPSYTKPDEDSTEIPDLCYANYDTIQVIRGKIYVFEEEWVWVLSDMKKLDPGYPKKIRDIFIGLPEHVAIVNAIYENIKGNVLIFYGRKYWEFIWNNESMTFNAVKNGNLKMLGIPRYVHEFTTAFRSNYNNKTYLIAYDTFWRFDESKASMDPGYPKSMGAWRNITYPVDAAIIWEEDTYFFRGPRFWRFDNTQVSAHEFYPVPTAPVWFPCAVKPEMSLYINNE